MESTKIADAKKDTILIIDDNITNIVLLEEVLHNNGFEKVYNMLGGIVKWKEKGFPVDTS